MIAQEPQTTRANIPEPPHTDWSTPTNSRATRSRSRKTLPFHKNRRFWSTQLRGRTHVVSFTELVLYIAIVHLTIKNNILIVPFRFPASSCIESTSRIDFRSFQTTRDLRRSTDGLVCPNSLLRIPRHPEQLPNRSEAPTGAHGIPWRPQKPMYKKTNTSITEAFLLNKYVSI